MDQQSSVQTGDGEGPPEKGTMRREDQDVAGAKDEIEMSQKESDDSAEVA